MVKWILVSLFVLSSQAFSQEEIDISSGLTLAKAIELAKSNSEDLHIKLAEMEKRQGQYREALGSVLPQISAEASWQKYFKEPVFFGNTVPISYQLQSGVTVNQTLWAFGRVAGALKAAKAGLKIGELEKELTENEVTYLTSVAYYTVLLSENQLKIATQTLDNAKENLRILQNKFAGGRPPQGDLVRLRSDVALRIPQVNQAKAEYQQAVLNLAQVIGREDLKELKLTTSFKTEFSPVNEEKILSDLESTQPRLELLRQNIQFSSEVARVHKASNLPTLGVFGTYNYSGASPDPLRSGDLYSSAFGGVALTWNIWDGGQGRARYHQAISDRMIAELGLKQGREALTLGLKRSFETYRSLLESHPSAKEAVSLAEKSFEISQRRFRTGQASITELNQTEAALTQARLGLALNLFQIHSTEAEIQNLTASKTGGLH